MLDYSKLPEKFRGGMERYFEHGIPPGDFLTAVLENDLMGAFGRADEDSRERLFSIVAWLYNEAPMGTYKSPEACRAHMQAMRERREATA